MHQISNDNLLANNVTINATGHLADNEISNGLDFYATEEKLCKSNGDLTRKRRSFILVADCLALPSLPERGQDLYWL
jgi:hypothetical protein